MRRTLFVTVMVAGLLFAGCTNPTTPSSTPTPTPESVVYSDFTYVDDQGIPDILEGFGLQGSVATFDGVYPGWSGIIPITIVNGLDRDRLFVMSLRSPSKVQAGYEALPQEYFSWITILEPSVMLLPGEVYQVPIMLSMPLDSDYTGKKAEVRILVEDTTQTGLVRIALDAKWFIITAE